MKSRQARKGLKKWQKAAAIIILVFAVVLFGLVVWPGGPALGLWHGGSIMQTCDCEMECITCEIDGNYVYECPPCAEAQGACHCSIDGNSCFDAGDCPVMQDMTWGKLKYSFMPSPTGNPE
jgi:hypothetical protein